MSTTPYPNFKLRLTTPRSYTGFSPASSPKTIQRQWPDYNPTLTVTDRKVMCNGGTSAELSAKVAAGGKIKAIWAQWTHEQGPVMVWMYKCSGDFSSCDGSGKKWFKVFPPPLSLSLAASHLAHPPSIHTNSSPRSTKKA